MKLKSSFTLSIGILALAGFAGAQDQTPHPWRSVNDPPPAGVAADPAQPQAPQAPDQGQTAQAAPDQAQNQGFPAEPQNAPPPPPANDPQAAQQAPPPPPPPGSQQGAQLPNNYGPGYAPPPPVPAQLTIKQGTYAIVRINQWLSSDRNKEGDAFTATLEQPLVVDGFVVAPRGATVVGKVTEAKKAGRVEGTSRLAIQLTELTLADGQQIPIQSQMISRNGPTSVGRDAAAIGGTTALGAAIGAGVGWGQGAAIGAGAGAAVGILGVLLTRGRPTVIYPESVATFQVTAPATFATDRAPLAFQYVSAQPDNGPQPYLTQRPPTGQYGAPYGAGAPYGSPAPAPGYGYGYGYPPAPYPYAYSYPYPYYYPYAGYYGGFGVYIGPRFGYGYRGFRR